MSAALTLAPKLAAERLRGARGGAALDLLAVIAFAVSAFLVLTVAGGTWMFIERAGSAPAGTAALFSSAQDAEEFLSAYVLLAAIACALLVAPVLNLGAGAARLGARGRAGRLASLRLVGATGGEVVAMSVVETLVQAAIGTVVGLGLWAVSLPAWRFVSFHNTPIGAGEMVPPWWLIVALVVGLLALAALSTVLGLQQVRISPLGVAARQTPRALRAWRLAVFVLALGAMLVFGQILMPAMTDIGWIITVFIALVLLVVGAVNLVGPWVLQLIARPGTRMGSTAGLIAARRIIDDPRAAWRNVSGTALLGMIATVVAIAPVQDPSWGLDALSAMLMADLRAGVLVTLAVGLVVAATSTLVNQGAVVFDRAEESVTLDHAGVPRSLFGAIRRRQVLMPLVATLGISIGTGVVLASPFLADFPFEAQGALLVAGTALVGVLLTLAAAEACRPLQSRVLDSAGRRND